MCHSTTTLKLCTCATNAQDLPHYWVLHRYHPETGVMVVGQLLLADYGLNQAYYERQQSILEQLTTGTPFDQPMALEDNDVLAIVLNNHQATQRMVFYYSYQQGTWEITTTDCFELESHYEELEQGKAEVEITNE
jgi:hypothetical protein